MAAVSLVRNEETRRETTRDRGRTYVGKMENEPILGTCRVKVNFRRRPLTHENMFCHLNAARATHSLLAPRERKNEELIDAPTTPPQKGIIQDKGLVLCYPFTFLAFRRISLATSECFRESQLLWL